MALSGCFVPAEYASFRSTLDIRPVVLGTYFIFCRIHDALLTRLSNDDDMEKSLSSFANEMASSSMILGLASPNSLVLIDELGRGTSPVEGVGISHAVAEALNDVKVYLTSISFDVRILRVAFSVSHSLLRMRTSFVGESGTRLYLQAFPPTFDHAVPPAFCCEVSVKLQS